MIFAVADLLGVEELLFLTAAQNSPSVSLDLQFGKIRTRSRGHYNSQSVFLVCVMTW